MQSTKFCIITGASGALHFHRGMTNTWSKPLYEPRVGVTATPTKYQCVGRCDVLPVHPLVFKQSEPLPDRNLLFDFNHPSSVLMISMEGTPLPPLRQIKPRLNQLIGSCRASTN